ncbi:MAG: exo-alpha-sialidase [Bacteroidaceae bacterium]|nr:exo-alpha-sialidase [Bacteroidaceae bacterium]
MRPFLLLSVFLLNVLYTFAAKTQPYTGSRIFWDSRTPVKVFGGGGYARVMELQDGRLIACCEWGGIRISFSSNKGQTWREPTTIVTNTNNVPNCVPDMIQLHDGTIIVAYNPRPSTPYTDDRRFSIRLKRSTDNGRTWGQEIVVYDAGSTPEVGCWEPCLLELPSGELQLYFADESPYDTNADQQISVCRSFDKGLTWSTPACVSYRAGFRDGMPVPVLLQDSTTIAVAIEDNGWGYNDFVPTIVRNSLTRNWKSFVPASSSLRTKAIDYNYCPVATGGAPYLRVLPNGETVLSHQSPYNHSGKPDMYVYVGNKSARNFKAMSSPFPVPQDQSALWNSLAVIDTGVVVAVSGYGGGVQMVKGYPRHQFEVPYGHPAVNGVRSVYEGYFSSKAEQILLGSETETYTYADLAYDDDSLYVICRVYDNLLVADGEHADVVSIGIETESAPYTTPQNTSYRYDVSPNATLALFKGTGTSWERQEPSASHLAFNANSRYYTFEMAVPWSELGREKAPLGKAMTFNIQVTNGDGTTHVEERIADAKPDGPFTWMPLHFHANEQETSLRQIPGQEPDVLQLVGSEGDYQLQASEEFCSVQILDLNGRSLMSLRGHYKSIRLPLLSPGLYVVRASFRSGETLSRKLSIRA